MSGQLRNISAMTAAFVRAQPRVAIGGGGLGALLLMQVTALLLLHPAF